MASIPAFPHKQIPNGYSTRVGGGWRAPDRDNLYESGDGEPEREEFGEEWAEQSCGQLQRGNF